MSSKPPPRIAYLDGRRLQRLLLAGIARLTAERRHLDRLNVFPVPDGDTGTNLALTFGTVAEAVAAATTRHAGELLTIAADAALDGARGNSGAIFAAWMQGLAAALANHARLDLPTLTAALAAGEQSARRALQNPVEGTVLTVMRDIAVELEPRKLPPDADFSQLMSSLLVHARKAVVDTRDTLEEMRAAGVEDAGALGLLLILEGMAEALQPGLAPPVAFAADADLARHAHAGSAHGVSGADRYCTECLITGSGIDQAAVRNELAQLGSSVVVVGNAAKLRLHVHVAAPEQVFRLARRHGLVSAEKADDMLRQERSLQTLNCQVAIVTDSAADLPAAVWDELGIQMVPLRVIFGAESHLDKVGLQPAEFFAELARNPEHPTTSQPSPGDFRRVFELLCSHFEHVLVICLTARLSGTHQAAVAAAGRCGRPGQVTVLDSHNVSAGLGLVVQFAAEAACSGAEPREVTAAALQAIESTRTYGLVPDLSHAVRGGRIPRAWRWLGSRLPVTFVLGLDAGRIRMRGLCLRSSDRVEALLKPALRDVRKLSGQPPRRVRLLIAHAAAPALAEELRRQCMVRFSAVESIAVAEMGPAVGVHGGPGTLALAVQACI
ncbi:MAG: DegV family protein [Gammaproteobacteria bacterium]